MENIIDLLGILNGIAWGPYMLALIAGTGLYLMLGLKLFPIIKLPFGFRHLSKKSSSKDKGDIEPRSALATALSATVGTGNIAGVASAIASVIILFHFTIGILLASKSFSFSILFKNGPIYGIIASVFFLYFELDVPGYLENTTFLLTYTTIFLVLMARGVALTRLKVVSWRDAVILGSVRVILGPIIGYSLIKFLNLSGFMAGVLLIQSAMPSAVLTYLVGSMYSKKRAVDNVASVIVSSTLLSFITIPIVVYISLSLFQLP